jgi:hypothetical protein
MEEAAAISSDIGGAWRIRKGAKKLSAEKFLRGVTRRSRIISFSLLLPFSLNFL